VRVSLPTAGPAVLVTAVGAAEGSRGAAAALACAGADVDRATLLIDVGGRPPRPTLLASAAAQRLEERLVAHLPAARVAARGHVCQLAVGEGPDDLEVALAAAAVARDELRVVHVESATTQALLGSPLGEEIGGVLLRADVATDRPLLALAVAGLLGQDLAVAVLKRRLPWVAERRALFGALPPEAAGGLPASVIRKLLSESCYGDGDDHEANPAVARSRKAPRP
jgi:hypothetical protein